MKPGTKLPIIAAAAIVVAVVAGTFFLRGDRTPTATAPDAVAAAQESAPSAGFAPPVARTAPSVPGRPATDEAMIEQLDQRARKREEHQARTAALKEQSAQRYASEQVDPAWAPGKITELNGIAADPAFDVAGAQPRNLSIDCRSSMCRIDGQFEDAGKAEDWILLYTASVGSAMPSSVISRTRNPDGTMRVEIYGRGR
ncbi:hypothetical protein GCM10007164_09370 [Luteimonas padinae]|uniref:Uncharacterized protein n=1 Tax=Luteimonas padinae TaxID=1714359 RepID=A0ABV6SZM7_9GAMM|nr:hypothetical protein [Luteimonas padinae]GHD68159.1 hypothetical protein GCM10007164_09370 [Luteimonas padinae]